MELAITRSTPSMNLDPMSETIILMAHMAAEIMVKTSPVPIVGADLLAQPASKYDPKILKIALSHVHLFNFEIDLSRKTDCNNGVNTTYKLVRNADFPA
jgi:hypothetical protein